MVNIFGYWTNESLEQDSKCRTDYFVRLLMGAEPDIIFAGATLRL